MMHPTDNGILVVCGPWDDVNRYIIDHGLDPAKIIKPHGATYSYPLTEDQVILLDGWEPDADDSLWFWQEVAANMFTPSDAVTLTERAKRVRGLLPEAWL